MLASPRLYLDILSKLCCQPTHLATLMDQLTALPMKYQEIIAIIASSVYIFHVCGGSSHFLHFIKVKFFRWSYLRETRKLGAK